MTHSLRSQSKEKRNKIELYHAVLHAIRDDLIYNESAKPTRIQFLSGTSYDKLIIHLKELEEKKLVTMDPITITEKGQKFLQEYDKINEMTKKLGLKFLRTD
ncbi:MAG: winged helix-turn-helix domain-containing protein [Candidatus Nitrosotenuis sp.]